MIDTLHGDQHSLLPGQRHIRIERKRLSEALSDWEKKKNRINHDQEGSGLRCQGLSKPLGGLKELEKACGSPA